MEIAPERTYSHLEFGDHDQGNYWTIDGPLSADLIAGLMLGIYVAYTDMIQNFGYRIHLEEADVYTLDPDNAEDEYSLQISEIPYGGLSRYISGEVGNIDTMEFDGTFDTFTWLILDPEQGIYFLVDFNSPEFIQGFISITQAFGVDFRNYVHRRPFKVINDQQEFYQIQGYEIQDMTEVD